MKLTPRERQVCDMLLEGYSNPEMAAKLGIAPRTVKAVMGRLFVKYGLAEESGIRRVKLAVKLYRESRSQ